VPQPKFDSDDPGVSLDFKAGVGRNGEMSAGFADADGTETVASYECVPGCPVRQLDEQTGERPGGNFPAGGKRSADGDSAYGAFRGNDQESRSMDDSGGASRFFASFEHQDEPRFRYVAKSSSAERNAGLNGFEVQDGAAIRPNSRQCNVCGNRSKWKGRWPNCEHDDWAWVQDDAVGDAEGRHKGALRNSHPT
jgi:hypothetical protein